MVRLLAFLFLFSGCGFSINSHTNPYRFAGHASEFEYIIKDFISDCEYYTNKRCDEVYKLPINFVSKVEMEEHNKTAVGICFSNGEIFISTESWKVLSLFKRKMLIYHELGHCYLGLSHNHQAISYLFWSTEDIMAPTLGNINIELEEELVYRLFTGDTDPILNKLKDSIYFINNEFMNKYYARLSGPNLTFRIGEDVVSCNLESEICEFRDFEINNNNLNFISTDFININQIQFDYSSQTIQILE